ncbi:uncharacterized protein EI90DRAFT_3001470 [Cantharellus anzutake]|uniref:uncharacterized protein n=1 Tax=Cantharellus anzutake TaxID=1750568 RepID=UPI0019055EEE|nr:uncharacterized protein EI90DRAFT_3010640 [Cantharellus anzutake]XP_038910633.1 uncharacterized protein EI90DRAFT_3001470 [Cantharellus anzutake]KAF8305224.1 hypothetical protein EI90DRAFT_3010640 [Cantharellus anzutake]KAF8321447.1 hypothetical protein EI90DRAFT_3001470 [Cantharellus anzutake]
MVKAFAAEPWSGKHKIILGFDIGTTFSGVSYAYLFPDGPQTVARVNAWPGQEAHKGESKIPTLLWYNKNKKATAFGAEALTAETQDEAEDNGWILARHFKLHLHPQTMKEKHNLTIDPLPEGVPLSTIYRDFFGYLIRHTQDAFTDRVLDGARVWKTYFPSADIVIAHPNGWGLREQEFMRRAAVAADVVPQSESHNRIFFVTEGEASVHYCMFHANLAPQFKPNVKFVVCDAGGSTVDTTAYSVSEVRPQLQLREVKPSACIQAGGIFVNKAAEEYFHRVFSNPEANLPPDESRDFVKKAIDDFETTAKKAFKDITTKGSVDIGQTRYTNPAVGVKRGRMTLDGTTTKTFFQPFVKQIVDSLREQMSGINCEHILLVGGFGENAFLRETLKKTFESKHCQVVTANDSTSKAVSDGVVIWHATTSVIARACRFQYGSIAYVPYDSKNPRHSERSTFRGIDGRENIDNVWHPIVKLGDVLQPDEGVAEAFFRNYKTPSPDLGRITSVMFAYTLNGQKEPYYAKDSAGNLVSGIEDVCTISADLSGLSGALEERWGSEGRYWRLDYKIGIRFGGTELQAYLEWVEDGVTRTSQAQLIPNSLM